MLVLCIVQKLEVKDLQLFQPSFELSNKISTYEHVSVSKNLAHISTFCCFKDGMPHERLLFQSLHVLNLVLIQHTDSTDS